MRKLLAVATFAALSAAMLPAPGASAEEIIGDPLIGGAPSGIIALGVHDPYDTLAFDPVSANAESICLDTSKVEDIGVAQSLPDGIGGILVWLTDGQSRVWLCDVNADGIVLSFSELEGDLLNGVGPRIIPADTSAANTPAAVCTALNNYAPVQVVSIVPDGVGDYTVWISDRDQDLWLCNASAEAEVFAYEYVPAEGGLPGVTLLAPTAS